MGNGPRIPQNPARAARSHEIRRTRYMENKATDSVVEVWDDGDDDLDTEANVSWGDEINVAGFEQIHLLVDFDFGDVGNDIADVFVVAQASPVGGSADEQWFDVYTDQAGDGNLVRKIYTAPVNTGANAKTRVAWNDTERVSYKMRFKLFVNGTTFTDSRATLKAQRVQTAQ